MSGLWKIILLFILVDCRAIELTTVMSSWKDKVLIDSLTDLLTVIKCCSIFQKQLKTLTSTCVQISSCGKPNPTTFTFPQMAQTHYKDQKLLSVGQFIVMEDKELQLSLHCLLSLLICTKTLISQFCQDCTEDWLLLCSLVFLLPVVITCFHLKICFYLQLLSLNLFFSYTFQYYEYVFLPHKQQD